MHTPWNAVSNILVREYKTTKFYNWYQNEVFLCFADHAATPVCIYHSTSTLTEIGNLQSKGPQLTEKKGQFEQAVNQAYSYTPRISSNLLCLLIMYEKCSIQASKHSELGHGQ